MCLGISPQMIPVNPDGIMVFELFLTWITEQKDLEKNKSKQLLQARNNETSKKRKRKNTFSKKVADSSKRASPGSWL